MAGLLAGLVLATTVATAGGPASEGAIVGASSFGIGLGGSVVGGLAGLGIGAATCGAATGPHCWAPVFGSMTGASIGYVGGTVWSAGWMAGRRGYDPRRARLWGFAGLGGGVLLTGVGAAVGWAPISAVGLTLATVGMPLGAGLSVGNESKSGAALWMEDGELRGLVLTQRF